MRFFDIESMRFWNTVYHSLFTSLGDDSQNYHMQEWPSTRVCFLWIPAGHFGGWHCALKRWSCVEAIKLCRSSFLHYHKLLFVFIFFSKSCWFSSSFHFFKDFWRPRIITRKYEPSFCVTTRKTHLHTLVAASTTTRVDIEGLSLPFSIAPTQRGLLWFNVESGCVWAPFAP